MKGRSGSGLLRTGNNQNGTTAALAGGAVGAIAGGGAGTTITGCASDDKTFYCRLVRFVNTIKMFITIIVIVIAIVFAIWFGYHYVKDMRKGSKK